MQVKFNFIDKHNARSLGQGFHACVRIQDRASMNKVPDNSKNNSVSCA